MLAQQALFCFSFKVLSQTHIRARLSPKKLNELLERHTSIPYPIQIPFIAQTDTFSA